MKVYKPSSSRNNSSSKPPILRWVLMVLLAFGLFYFYQGSSKPNNQENAASSVKNKSSESRDLNIGYRLQSGKRKDEKYQWEVLVTQDTLYREQLKSLSDSLGSSWAIWEEFLFYWRPNQPFSILAIYRDSRFKKLESISYKTKTKQKGYCLQNNGWIGTDGCQRGLNCLENPFVQNKWKKSKKEKKYLIQGVKGGTFRSPWKMKVLKLDSLATGWNISFHHYANVYSHLKGLNEVAEGLKEEQWLDPKEAIGYFPKSGKLEFVFEKEGQWLWLPTPSVKRSCLLLPSG
jgi:hypothetical protein